ncbi:hypothetical protein QYF48_12275 [Brevibacillus agri]|uniref:hypothetical protein n=1 Tax=Brevibacillus agri TaxID=51101 RepID=UPI0025B7045F|nr:hypothetical protein [Brevibacillus agri]MDN4093592.1 hypothetical protein [Brevibacillus agri]
MDYTYVFLIALGFICLVVLSWIFRDKDEVSKGIVSAFISGFINVISLGLNNKKEK